MKGLIFCFTFSLFLCYFSVNGSGYFKSPLNRGSYYRYLGGASYADKITVNRDDAELNCGGQHTLGRDLSGLCGACGDPVNGVKAHEAGGPYAIGYPTAIYNESTIINVTVTIVNKKRGGFFEFYLCESDSTTAVTEACFQQHPLKFAGTDETRTRIGDVEEDVTFELQLPSGVVCQYCVMRMTWVTANEYRCDPTGLCGLGYWDQISYVNCADVSILTQGSPIPPDFEYPDYTSLYASIDGGGATGSSTAATTTTPVLTQVPIGDTTTINSLTTTPAATPQTTTPVIPVVTVPTGPTVTGTTEVLPAVTTEKLIGPFIPFIGGGGGAGLAGLGLISPFLPFAGIAGLGGLALMNRYRRQRGYPGSLTFSRPGPISYSAVPVLGSPMYLPSTQLVIERHYELPSQVTTYNEPQKYRGYGKYNNGYNGYNSNYGNSGYKSNYGNSGYKSNYGNSGYKSNYGNGGYNSNYGNNNNYGNSYGNGYGK